MTKTKKLYSIGMLALMAAQPIREQKPPQEPTQEASTNEDEKQSLRCRTLLQLLYFFGTSESKERFNEEQRDETLAKCKTNSEITENKKEIDEAN